MPTSVSQLPKALKRQELARAVSNSSTTELLARPMFPMYVVAVSDLAQLSAPIPPHEEMMRRGLLYEVSRQSRWPLTW
eukprot:COSAG04_NODE_29410_length_269_cov_0.611765_1_plen_78_part_01